MKPIIITIQDNKIIMDINEFKKHIDDAYNQGYRDASSITCSTSTNRWWNDLTPRLSGVTDIETTIRYDNDDSNYSVSAL